MKHLSDETLSAHLDRALTGRAAEEAERHLAACEACREALAELASQDQGLRPALAHDPGEEYFERFATRVEERIGTKAPEPARRPVLGIDLGRLLESPRALAWAGGAAALIAGAGIVLITTRDVRPPELRERDVAGRLEQVAPGVGKEDAGAKQSPVTREAAPTAPPAVVVVPDARDEQAGASAPAPGPAVGSQSAQLATPARPQARDAMDARAREVRVNEAGESIPVRKDQARTFAAPPPATTATRAQEEEGATARKKTRAEPLQSAPAPEPAAGNFKFMEPPAGKAAAGRSFDALQKVEGEVRLCGEVRDAAGRPVAGAQVVVTDLGRAATTDARGGFCVQAPAGEHPLSVMAVGYSEARRTVQVGADPRPLRVTLDAVAVLDDKRAGIPGRTPLPRVQVAPPAERQDRYSTLPDTVRAVVRATQDIEASARSRRSASLYDAAAAGWARSLRRLEGGPLELETRWHLAETRYLAWEAGPSDRRAAAAVEALTAYVVRAPAGPQRDQATRWLDQVKR